MKTRSAPNPLLRVVASALLVVGLALTIGAIFADQLDLVGDGAGLGWKQLIGVIVGLVLLLIGAAWLVQPPVRRRLDE